MSGILKAGAIIGALGSALYLYDIYQEEQKKLIRNQLSDSGTLEEKLAKNILYANQRAFKWNVREASKQPNGIAGLKIGERKLDLPLTLANHLLTTHQSEPYDFSNIQAPEDIDNSEYEQHQETMDKLTQMLVDLAGYCNFAQFNDRTSEPALDILMRINHPELIIGMRSILANYRQQGAFKSLNDVAPIDLLVNTIFVSEDLFAMLVDPKYGNMDINKRDPNGNTALHRLMLSERPNAKGYLSYFIKYGADLSIVNNNKQTARDLALAKGMKAEDFDNQVNVALHWKMHTVTENHIQNFSRDEFSAFICTAARIWGKSNPQHAAEVQPMIDKALTRLWNGQYKMQKAWLVDRTDVKPLILSTHQTADQFSDFLWRVTDYWYNCKLAAYVKQNPMTRDELASFCRAVANFCVKTNPAHKAEQANIEFNWHVSRLYADKMPAIEPMDLPDEVLKNIITVTETYSLYYILSTIVKTWEQTLTAQATMKSRLRA